MITDKGHSLCLLSGLPNLSQDIKIPPDKEYCYNIVKVFNSTSFHCIGITQYKELSAHLEYLLLQQS